MDALRPRRKRGRPYKFQEGVWAKASHRLKIDMNGVLLVCPELQAMEAKEYAYMHRSHLSSLYIINYYVIFLCSLQGYLFNMHVYSIYNIPSDVLSPSNRRLLSF